MQARNGGYRQEITEVLAAPDERAAGSARRRRRGRGWDGEGGDNNKVWIRPVTNVRERNKRLSSQCTHRV